MFIVLTRTGGQQVLVNGEQVAAVRDRAEGKPVVILLSNGNDFEVNESFEDINNWLSQT